MLNNQKIIPLIFVGIIIMFTIIVLMFVYTAHSTFTGLVTENAYQKGLDFGKINEFSLLHPGSDIRADISIINDNINLKINTSLENYNIEAKIVKPVSAEFDQLLEFTKKSPNIYQVKLPPLDKGVWEIRVKVIHESQDYVFNRRFQIF